VGGRGNQKARCREKGGGIKVHSGKKVNTEKAKKKKICGGTGWGKEGRSGISRNEDLRNPANPEQKE